MKIILFLLIPVFLFGQTVDFYDDVYFNQDSLKGDPVSRFDNTFWVEWFDKLPIEWKGDFYDAGWVEKRKVGRDEYYVLSLPTKEWTSETGKGAVKFDKVPDSLNYFGYGSRFIAYQDSGVKDLTIIDFDSVEITEYSWKLPRVVTPVGVLMESISDLFSESIEQDIVATKKLKKIGRRIRYPNQPHFVSWKNRKNKVKQWRNFKAARIGKPSPYNVPGGIVLPDGRGHIDGGDGVVN